ncbi:MAG: LptF/LptG family permease [Paludibacteraceae bacterium]|nr:LptF/LptG family permease [Paludibacteraceae bacterium]
MKQNIGIIVNKLRNATTICCDKSKRLFSGIIHCDYKTLLPRIKEFYRQNPPLNTLDRYILKKFLSTFALSIVLIISICVVVDISEKLDSFYETHAPLDKIIFQYYLNFIPYFTNMFSPLFVFIAVIFFTSKMAYNSEITAILAGGVSFRRMMKPYMVGAFGITLLCFILSGYVIPQSNKIRLDFENVYYHTFKNEVASNIQMEVTPGIILYIDRFEHSENRGFHCFLQKFEGKKLVSFTTAQTIEWSPSDSVWHMGNWMTRSFDGVFENVTAGDGLDTLIDVVPMEFFINEEYAPQMTNYELRHYINRQHERGMGNTQPFEVEYHKRFATPVCIIILTLIGVSLSSKKVKGGMGLQIGIGIALSAIYVLFLEITAIFAIQGNTPVMLATWIPNIIFAVVATFLYRRTPK